VDMFFFGYPTLFLKGWFYKDLLLIYYGELSKSYSLGFVESLVRVCVLALYALALPKLLCCALEQILSLALYAVACSGHIARSSRCLCARRFSHHFLIF